MYSDEYFGSNTLNEEEVENIYKGRNDENYKEFLIYGNMATFFSCKCFRSSNLLYLKMICIKTIKPFWSNPRIKISTPRAIKLAILVDGFLV